MGTNSLTYMGESFTKMGTLYGTTFSSCLLYLDYLDLKCAHSHTSTGVCVFFTARWKRQTDLAGPVTYPTGWWTECTWWEGAQRRTGGEKNNQRRNRRAHQGALQFWRALIWSSFPLLPHSPFPRSLTIQPLQPFCSFIFPFPLSNPHTCLPHLVLSLNPWVFYPVIASFFNLIP